MTPLTRDDALAALTALCAAPDETFDLTAVCIACSLHDDPNQPLSNAMAVLDEIAEGARALHGDPTLALPTLLHDRLGFSGNVKAYDDLSNADLLHVLWSRKGLPVTLGIIYRHAARAAGIQLSGVDAPGHFFLRLETDAGLSYLDAFADGRKLESPDLLRLANAAGLSHFTLDMLAPMSDRRIALRLQNNIWSRARHVNQWDVAERAARRRCLLVRSPQLKLDHAEALAALGAIMGARAVLQDARGLHPDTNLAFDIEHLDNSLRQQLQ